MMNYGLRIKPLSANDAYTGRRYRTKEYNQYRKDLFVLLPRGLKIPKGPLSLKLEFGVSSRGSDGDNPVKPFIDILQKAYEFNDNQIYHYDIRKKIVKKGAEYIIFSVTEDE